MPTIKEILVDQAETSDKEQAHAKIREQVLDRASRGLHTSLSPDLILAAFDGHPDEFADYQARLRAAKETRQQREEDAANARELREETKRVLAEWDAERRAKAEAEARKRLGQAA